MSSSFQAFVKETLRYALLLSDVNYRYSIFVVLIIGGVSLLQLVLPMRRLRMIPTKIITFQKVQPSLQISGNSFYVKDVSGSRVLFHTPMACPSFYSSISRDPELFGPDPVSFRPDRFLVSDAHPRIRHFDLAFGFGRRICPGQHVAEQAVFLCVARYVICLIFWL